jgi:hypothetical protein
MKLACVRYFVSDEKLINMEIVTKEWGHFYNDLKIWVKLWSIRRLEEFGGQDRKSLEPVSRVLQVILMKVQKMRLRN